MSATVQTSGNSCSPCTEDGAFLNRQDSWRWKNKHPGEITCPD